MNPILRVLRMATETDRRYWMVIFLAIVDFCCVLLALERYDKGDIRVGTYWLLAGIALSLLGWKWPQIKHRFGGKAPKTTMPEFRPRVLPVEYAKAEKDSRCGLYIRNPGYDALDVEIATAHIGESKYNLIFHERLAQFGERSGNAFFEASIEPIQGEKLPLRGGCDLHEIMRNSDTEAVNFGIVYKDTDFRSYRTNVRLSGQIEHATA
jgi:hypothetical protein